nr:MAG TPA: DNA N-6-adenine-methyltransferase [Caudoviricetes sp.]
MMYEGQTTMFDDNPEYEAFVEKFKPKKTTDDCYTPPLVYEAVRDWACAEYGIAPSAIVRPFYPGGDYERFEYPDDCFVLDNPPFSILSKICSFYLEREIPFFLFAPSLTCLCGKLAVKMNHIIADADIVYENGAVVKTAFVTSCGGDIVLQTAPDLRAAIIEANKKTRETRKKPLPKYEYPEHVITAARAQYLASHGIAYQVRRSDCAFIRTMDAQKEAGKAIFGGGLLLSERAAAERAAAERWQLSAREMELVASMGAAR